MVDQIPMRDMARQAPVLAARGQRVVEARTPLPVVAWIIDGRGQDVQIRGQAVAWTSTLVRIVYTDAVGRQGSLWWWASAVQRDDDVVDSPTAIDTPAVDSRVGFILGGPARPGRGHPAGRGM